MFTPLLAALFGASAAINYTLPPPAPRPAKSSKCAADCSSRYRLPEASDDSPSMKYRALAEDGTKCNVVGSKLCTSNGRTIWRGQY